MIGSLIAKSKLRTGFQSLNKKDLKSFLSGWTKDSTFVYPGNVFASGTYKGIDEIEKWFSQLLNHFVEIHFEVQNVCVDNIFDFLGNNVATVIWTVTITNKNGETISNSGITKLTIKYGKAVYVQDYIFDLGDKFIREWSI